MDDINPEDSVSNISKRTSRGSYNSSRSGASSSAVRKAALVARAAKLAVL